MVNIIDRVVEVHLIPNSTRRGNYYLRETRYELLLGRTQISFHMFEIPITLIIWCLKNTHMEAGQV